MNETMRYSLSLPQADRVEIKQANISHIYIVCENFKTNTFTVSLSSILIKKKCTSDAK